MKELPTQGGYATFMLYPAMKIIFHMIHMPLTANMVVKSSKVAWHDVSYPGGRTMQTGLEGMATFALAEDVAVKTG